MSNWFYIRKWNDNREKSIGKEMSIQDARFLYRSLETYSRDNNSVYFVLLSKDGIGKVVSRKEDIGDWEVLEKTYNFPTDDSNGLVK